MINQSVIEYSQEKYEDVLLLYIRRAKDGFDSSSMLFSRLINTDLLDPDLMQKECDLYNCRLYVRPISCDNKKFKLDIAKKMLECLDDPNYTGFSVISQMCLLQKADFFLVDCDIEKAMNVIEFTNILDNIALDLKRLTNIKIEYKTPNGWHFIVDKFNTKLFQPMTCKYDLDVTVDKNPILLMAWQSSL
jgi:hypothetical protein